MITFRHFIAEQAAAGKLTHLTHAEDMLFSGSGQHAIDTLKAVDDKIKGGQNSTYVSTKYDGSPSLVYGHNPENGRFFVATKSAFNVNPKINYTPEDVERNHGHAPGLANKLKLSLQHLPKIAPKKGVFQGDLMHSAEDLSVTNNKLNFKPNTISYSINRQSPHGRRAASSQLGIVTHTKYIGNSLENMEAQPLHSSTSFNQHKDVHQIDPTIDFNDTKHTPSSQAQFNTHITQAEELHSKQPQEFHHAIQQHTSHLEPYINATVRSGEKPSTKGYVSFLQSKGEKEVDSVKTPKAKQQKQSFSDARIQHVTDNQQHFDTAFKIHHHIQQAKNALVDTLSNGSDFEHTIGGVATKPEGFVATHNGKMVKLVDRTEFSRQNLLAGGIRQKKEQ